MSTGLRFTLEVDGLPPDAFAVVSFHLNQSLSSLFSLDLSLVSQQFLSLEFAQVLDKMAYLTIWQGDEVQRRVKGVVTWFELGENDKNQMLYSMKVHPPLWRAGLRQNFRIFQNEDIKSILGTMLQENGVTEWSPLFSEPHPSREFCVQYGETDYDFLCRMAAEEGIFFYEEHAYKSTDQSLVLCDTVRHLPESFEIPWNPNTRTEVSTLCISQFRYSAQIRPSSVVTKDYTFKRPGWAGRFEQEGQHQDYQRTQYEVYDYPGRFKSAHGQNFARWQMDGWRNNAETARGMGRSPEIWPGRRIVLTGHPQANLNREWQVVASELHGEQPQAVPGRQGAGTALENHFAVIPADRTWRPQPLLKPLVDGPQSAVVTGPAPEDERDRHPGESLLKTTYRYNAAGELTEVILPGDETLTFSRDEAGREVLRHSNRGFACEQGWNAAGQPVSQRAGFFPEEATWDGLVPSLVREYRYDSAGNVSGVTSREDYGRETRREYRLDRNGQVTAVTASGTGLGYGEGDESYGYDSCGYLKAQSAGRHRISEETERYAGGHRLKQAGNMQYDYDAAGRMVSRTRHRDGYRPETERFRWDSRDQLTGYCSAQGEQWEYRHDASGRRTEKRCDRKKIRFTYLWDGDSIAEIREYRDDKLYSVRHLVFNGFELISQQFSRVRQAHPSVAPQWVTRTNHAVSDLTGRPLMLFNSEGKTVWRPGQTSLWGLALSLPADTGYPDPRGELDPEAAPGLLYAGQWQDVESGLCYNRFRYYEPETGMYLVSDPLGLQGGEQTYRYVPNPLRWIDPLGLNKGASLSKMMNSSSDLMGLRRQPQNFWRLYSGKDI
ncbi:type VI secretion system tip protein VgrG [Escherichia coli]|uniref:type VI secretion system tip protein TssI/VgrG n=1 Tax=Escherichia coli TaxID=562 RepID=UPI00189FF8BA|nr:type VI secretion system tip protein TssI/VgrG [Escherichia coli]QPE11884.1 type VI secretion system tip protein VgrG [Escherichia coli]QPE25079.1 type VI secretion system tip protein VgrG [Escherichia coli]QPE29651.1 type VI secretion system tip protein VgrG [Escherichia coli]QPE34217.1 type VI secretion system tip protein VgrG [Escherichia coli]QPE38799.1 type VI secretion system tip protein VgrG [Escherichia coli]